MRRTNWKAVAKSTKILRKNVKNLKSVSDYLSNIPGEGEFRDNISKNIVKITDCKTSSLRRYAKLLENYFYLVTSEKDRTMISNKQLEIQNELNVREDGIVEVLPDSDT